MHHPWQVGVIEAVGVADALAGFELEVLAAEGVAVARAEVGERHPEVAADPGFQLRHPAGEAVGRQPLGQRIRLDKGPIDPHRWRLEHPVQSYCSRRHGQLLLIEIRIKDSRQRWVIPV